MKPASSTATGWFGDQAQHQRAHRDAVVHVGRDRPAARRAAGRCHARSGRRPRSRPARRWPPAARRWRRAGRSPSPATPSGRACAWCPRRRRRRRRGSDIRRSCWARAPAARRRRAARRAGTTRSPTGSPPSMRRFSTAMSAPISASVANRPVRSGLSPTPAMRQPRARHQQRRDQRERGRGRIARHHDIGGAQLRLAVQRDDPARARPAPPAPSAPKWRSMFSLWSRVASGSSTRVMPRRVQAGQQHRRLHLRRRHRHAVVQRQRVARALDGQRQPAAVARGEAGAACAPAARSPGASAAGAGWRRRSSPRRSDGWPGCRTAAARRCRNCPCRARPPARSARRCRGRRRARCRRRRACTSAPSARIAAAVRSTSSPSSRPVMRGLAHRQRAEHQRAVADRLVARHARCVPASGAAARRESNGLRGDGLHAAGSR